MGFPADIGERGAFIGSDPEEILVTSLLQLVGQHERLLGAA